MKNLILVIIGLALGITACKKKESNLVISGVVSDKNLHTSIAGVTIKLYEKKVEPGVLNETYYLKSTTNSDNSGNFKFEFENTRTSGLKLVFNKLNYFSSSSEINPENVINSQPYASNAEIYSQGFLRIKIKNTSPYNTSDQISYQMTSGALNAENCCGDSIINLTGKFIDTTFTCIVHGSELIKFEWLVTKHNNSILHKDSILSVPFDTTDVTINY